MTDDLYALDKAVTEAKDRVVAAADAWGESDTTTLPSYDLADAVVEYRAALAAKRKAMTPTPLSAEEAHTIWNSPAYKLNALNPDRWQAVLTACRERDLKLIEALPAESISHMGSPVVHWIKREDVRRALTSGGQ